MSGNSAHGSVNFSDLTDSIKNESDHLIPIDNQPNENTDDFFLVKRYSTQARDICLVRQNNGFGQKSVCMFVTKCYCYIADDDNEDDDDENEPRVEFYLHRR